MQQKRGNVKPQPYFVISKIATVFSKAIVFLFAILLFADSQRKGRHAKNNHISSRIYNEKGLRTVRNVVFIKETKDFSGDPATNAAIYQLTSDLLSQLNLGGNLEGLLDSMYSRLSNILPCDRLAVAVIEGEPLLLRLITCRSGSKLMLKPGYASRLRGSTLAHLIDTGESRIINDLAQYHRVKPISGSTKLILSEGMLSNLTVPLIAEGKPIGVLFASSRRSNAYDHRHATLLASLAGHIAISIEKSRWAAELEQTNARLSDANSVKDRFLVLLRDEVDRQTERLSLSERRFRILVRLGQLVTSSLNLNEVFERAAIELRSLLGCDWVALSAAGTADENFDLAIEFDLSGKPVHLPSASVSPSKSDRRVAFKRDDRYESLPLISRGRTIGWLSIALSDREPPISWDRELLGEIATQLGVAVDNATAYGKIERLKRQLEQQNSYLKEEMRTDQGMDEIIGISQAIRKVRLAIRQVSATDATVLLLGETGTGKELIARAIHESSGRYDKLLIKVNCAALSPDLITSELFGHEPGAFTGAIGKRIGRFELADGGTILLDEVSEIPLETQALLLRVLQERTLERVGGNVPIRINTRVIATTNRDLKSYSAQGHFRSDLFYRLHVFPIQVPPLRDRKEDIPLLASHFLARFAKKLGRMVPKFRNSTMDLLLRHDWPGNVRELENLLERATIVNAGEELIIDPSWLSEPPAKRPREQICDESKVPPAHEMNPDLDGPLAELERRSILRVIEKCSGRIYGPSGAAKVLGLKPTTLYGKMKKLGIRVRKHGEPAD
jgi:formate hydrogenlyase transcriptional activator